MNAFCFLRIGIPNIVPNKEQKIIWVCHHPDKWADSLCVYLPIFQDAVGLSTLLRQLVAIPHASLTTLAVINKICCFNQYLKVKALKIISF
jgi:hypothetical protein